MKAVIIEDDDIISRVLENKIKKIAPDVQVLEILPSLKTARRYRSENAKPDLMYMDIQLGDDVSFDIFNNFKLSCPLTYTTAYDKYAIRAFKVNGVDYLLKPIKDAELEAAIEKCRRMVEKKDKPPTDFIELVKSLANPATTNKFKEKIIVNIRN